MRSMEWKQIPDFENYEVSDAGLVRNTDTGNILAKSKIGKYCVAKLRRGGCFTRQLHNVVGQAFLRPLFEGECYAHISDDISDNSVGNIHIVKRTRSPGRPRGHVQKQVPLTKRKPGRPVGWRKEKTGSYVIPDDREAHAERAMQRERERRAAYFAAIEAKRAEAAEAAFQQVENYNARVLEQRAEREKARAKENRGPLKRPPDTRDVKERLDELSGWLKKTEAGNWQAWKRIDGEGRLLGTFKTIGEAAKAALSFAQCIQRHSGGRCV
jgi:hypothetical protein